MLASRRSERARAGRRRKTASADVPERMSPAVVARELGADEGLGRHERGNCTRLRLAPPCARAAPSSSSSSPPRCRASRRCCTSAAPSSRRSPTRATTSPGRTSRTGTYGFIPGHPSAYTQPLYGWFLIPLYWIFGRHWEVVGLAQICVAVATTLDRLADRPALAHARRRPDRRAARRAAPVPRLARRAHEPRDPRPPARGVRSST